MDSSPTTGVAPASSTALGDALAIARHHIVLIAMAASLVFGFLFAETYDVPLALVVGLDWFLINLMNRITDLAEDQKNGIAGTGLVARHPRALTWASFALMLGSFAGTHLVWPALTPWRVAVQVIGLGYNYDIVPTLRGLSRFKQLYFLKNFMSAVLFVLTCFVYGLVVHEPEPSVAYVVTLVLFFIPFELTYEILYDLRDIEGDRDEGVPTYPVVHGPERARQILDALLVLSVAVVLLGFVARILGVRELLFVAAPLLQLAFYRPRYRRGLTPRDCILVTHLGTGLLVLYLVGTALWLRAGLPANLYL